MPRDGKLLCQPHVGGLSKALQEAPWYNAGCSVCDDKLARGLVKATDPTSGEVDSAERVRRRAVGRTPAAKARLWANRAAIKKARWERNSW